MKYLLFTMIFSIICSTAFANEVKTFSFIRDYQNPLRIKKLNLKYSFDTDAITDVKDIYAVECYINSSYSLHDFLEIYQEYKVKKNKIFQNFVYKKWYNKGTITLKKGKIFVDMKWKNSFFDNVMISNWFDNTVGMSDPKVKPMTIKTVVKYGWMEKAITNTVYFNNQYFRKKDILKAKKVKDKKAEEKKAEV